MSAAESVALANSKTGHLSFSRSSELKFHTGRSKESLSRRLSGTCAMKQIVRIVWVIDVHFWRSADTGWNAPL